MNLHSAAAAAQVSKRTLYNWMQRGMLAYTEPTRTRRQVRLEDVQATKARWYNKMHTPRQIRRTLVT